MFTFELSDIFRAQPAEKSDSISGEIKEKSEWDKL